MPQQPGVGTGEDPAMGGEERPHRVRRVGPGRGACRERGDPPGYSHPCTSYHRDQL
jgi:hypothetical protein